jgi:N-hydroxyarylamine O-acetyltransferase
VDHAAYLARIGIRGSVSTSAEDLRRLQVAHLLAVPFENLSIHWGEPIVLNEAALFDKIVTRRRGGFCFELNGLFAALLRELGFQVELLSASVADKEGRFGPEFDHLTLLVTLEERWLVDVGFGDSFVEPLRLDERAEQVQGRSRFRIDRDAERRHPVVRRDGDGPWRAQFRFDLQPRALGDFAERSRYHQTSPESHFTLRPFCSKAAVGGRRILNGMRWSVIECGERVDQEIADEREWAATLLREFAITGPRSR